MTSVARALTLLATLVLLILPMAPAQAQVNRSWVSNSGSDANPCFLASPCASFQVAHDNTNPHGEINCLDPGNFGTLTIQKWISIVCDKEIAHIGVPQSGFGITVTVDASDEVTLANDSL